MMGKYYHKKTQRSKRKMQNFENNAVTVSLGDGKANFQMVLPMSEMLFDVAGAIEQSVSTLGLCMMKALIDEEVEQLTGSRYVHQPDRQTIRWGKEDSHVIFSGRKVAIEKPRVRTRYNKEVPLRRWDAFAHPGRMEQAVENKILRRVSTRDYSGAIEDICDGYGIDKSSVSRQWKAASVKQLEKLMQRRLDDLDICVILLDGKEFGKDTTIITALGVDATGAKHVLGLWPGATENSVVCGCLLDDMIQRGLPLDKQYLFVIDGSKALKKAITDRFGKSALTQRCRIHKQRNICKYLPKKYHRLLAMKLRAAFGMTDYAEALKELTKVGDWLTSISDAAASSLEEGFEELLTVNKLKLPASLKKLFSSTNIIESCYSVVGELCHNVKRWRGESMAMRWVGTMLLETEKRFYHIKGYREIPMLTAVLKRHVDKKEAVA